MKFFPLIWAGLWRKKGRTALNLISILAAFTLFGTLQGISTLLSSAGNTLKGNRLLVLSQEPGLLPRLSRPNPAGAERGVGRFP
jgi:putative ABC transport system permease protein